jgi:glycosyltransferase involved in cell wall biosynthesis
MKIRIVFTIPNFTTAGSGQALVNIVLRLDRSMFEPTVCVSKRGGALEKVLEENGVEVIELPFTVEAKPYGGLPRKIRQGARDFKPLGFDIWHSFHYSDDYTEPLIARAAGAKGWVYTKKNMNWGHRSWWLRSMLASRIAAQNTDMLRQFFSTWPLRSRTRLIHRGVDTAVFSAGTPARLDLRKSLRIASDSLVVTSVADLLPVKGQHILIKAAAPLPGVHVFLSGSMREEEYVAHLRALISELDMTSRVHFVGRIDDVAALHAESDIVVLATLAKWRMEGCPVALLEAMSSERPCIATDVPGSRDIIESGKNGILVPPEDPASLSVAIRMLVESPDMRTRLRLAARQRIIDDYTIEREVRAHEALYGEVLGL